MQKEQIDIADLDYFRTKDDIIFIVRGYYHPEDYIIGHPVFWGNPQGERIHPSGRRYEKDIEDVYNERLFRLLPDYKNTEIPKFAAKVPRDRIIEIFKPREALRTFLKNHKKTLWTELVFSFRDLAGIPLEDIGIFGSHLVGLSHNRSDNLQKDIDFAIYGLENFYRLKSSIEKIRNKFGFSKISPSHIKWHTKKYGQSLSKEATNFPKTLKRKWSSLQIAEELLTTVRFVYKKDEIPPNPIISPELKEIEVEGIVTDPDGTNFMPRVFKIKSNEKTFTIVSYYWAFQSPVKIDDGVRITGMLHQDEKVISLDSPHHGIKIIGNN